jgi:hypothetical protein
MMDQVQKNGNIEFSNFLANIAVAIFRANVVVGIQKPPYRSGREQ